MKKSHLKATTLRTAMIVAIFIIIGLSTAGFYYAQDQLGKFATEVNNTTPKSTVDSTDTKAIKQLKDDIANHQAAADKANAIVASSQNYQSQVTQDLNKYASSADVSIKDYNFAPVTDATKSLASISGLQSNSATITLKSPAPFTNLMQFIKAVESNLPKMQFTSINLSSTTNSGNSVSVEPLTIGIYTR